MLTREWASLHCPPAPIGDSGLLHGQWVCLAQGGSCRRLHQAGEGAGNRDPSARREDRDISAASEGRLFEGIGPGGDETILVCEDDDAVRTMTAQILTGNGYTVISAQDGADALELALAHEGTISMLLTDVIMPEMDGQELCRRLTAILPHLKVIYMSGYADDVLAPLSIADGNTRFIEKPFLAEGLLLVTRTMLDTPKPGAG